MNNPLKPDLDALLTVESVAHLFMVSSTTIRNWAKNGQLPAIKIGRLWRFRRADVEAWGRTPPAVERQPFTSSPQSE